MKIVGGVEDARSGTVADATDADAGSESSSSSSPDWMASSTFSVDRAYRLALGDRGGVLKCFCARDLSITPCLQEVNFFWLVVRADIEVEDRCDNIGEPS
jgi:hypothetical protein